MEDALHLSRPDRSSISRHPKRLERVGVYGAHPFFTIVDGKYGVP